MELLSTREHAAAERGITLVETLAALLILGIVAVAILTMFTHSMQLNATGADYTALTNEAKDKSEELLTLAYNHADLAPGVVHTETIADPPLQITWRVAEHHINQDHDDPTQAWGLDPNTSTAAGTGNIKVVAVTVASSSLVRLGRRDITVQALKTP
jgi:hypothetical protein